jgi:type IV pilus assembly protein PilC
MPAFRYQALNADQRLITGELSAATVEQAVTQLHSAGLAVQSISLISPTPTHVPAGIAPTVDTNVEQAALQTHMVRVLEQGKPIAPALRAYAEEMPRGRRRRQLCQVVDVLQRGDSAEATTALAALPEYWIPLLSAATSSRDPGRVLREFLSESQQADELYRQRWLTFAYPALVLGIAAAVFIALSFVALPIFQTVFSDFNLELPAFTRVVMTLASWVTDGQALIFVLICGALGAILWTGRRLLPASVRSSFNSRFSMPWGRRTAIAKFARFTADLLEGGLSTPDALRIAGFATKNPPLRAAAWRLANEIASGSQRAQSADERPLTATLLHAINADIPASARINLLREISNCYAARTRMFFSWTRGLIEPLSICAVGLVVGGVVIALFTPLVSLVEGLSN